MAHGYNIVKKKANFLSENMICWHCNGFNGNTYSGSLQKDSMSAGRLHPLLVRLPQLARPHAAHAAIPFALAVPHSSPS